MNFGRDTHVTVIKSYFLIVSQRLNSAQEDNPHTIKQPCGNWSQCLLVLSMVLMFLAQSS